MSRRFAAPEIRIPLAMVLEAVPRAVKALSDPERAALRELQSEVRRATCGGEFDPRHLLQREWTPAELETWRHRRRAFVAQHLANDSRVVASTDA